MLKFNIKHPYLKTNFLVEDIYDYENLEDQFTDANAEGEIEKFIELAKKLGAIDPKFETNRIIQSLQNSVEIYRDHLANDDDYDWMDGTEIVPFGDYGEMHLFSVARTNGLGCTLNEWLEQANNLEEHDMAKLHWLIVEKGYDFDDAIPKLEDTYVYKDTLRKTAEALFDECLLSEIPEHLQTYVDYDDYAYTMQVSSELMEFKFAGNTWTAENR